MTSTFQASLAVADQAVNPIKHVNLVNYKDHVDVVNHVDRVDHVDYANPPQYDGSHAWLFELIINVENSDDE